MARQGALYLPVAANMALRTLPMSGNGVEDMGNI
jgi:hypothetical protein